MITIEKPTLGYVEARKAASTPSVGNVPMNHFTPPLPLGASDLKKGDPPKDSRVTAVLPFLADGLYLLSCPIKNWKMASQKIIPRIVQESPSKLYQKESAWLSVLGTRVQMGQTTFAVASELVGHSYANLVLVSPSSTIKGDDKKEDSKQTAKICFRLRTVGNVSHG